MRILLFYIFFFAFIALSSCKNNSKTIQLGSEYISDKQLSNSFQLLNNETAVPLVCNVNDYSGVLKIAKVFSEDIERVSGKLPAIYTESIPKTDRIIIIGTLGNNPWIDTLAAEQKIETSLIENKWEASLIQTVKNPFNGVKEALVIAGSDKRGTIYGMFDFSKQIGVSPWYWWADVPVKHNDNIYFKSGIYTQGEPAVKYRGIFINDEAPALSGWVYEKYGEFNSEFYYQVFELLLRLKGNYLWPAMWGRMFYVNDTNNPILADELGIVMGTSHHEPLTRAHHEWQIFGKNEWNFDKNSAVLKNFWKDGLKRMGQTETILSIGMRGDGDEPMSEESNIRLLEEIVKTQRNIIEEVSGKPASEQPQLWALYKEVQEYYDKGMRVPDDVTLLLCDDNWGNVRKLPSTEELKHTGGYGMYYHFDYVGAPRNYKWLNTNLIPRIWEQMQLTYSHHVDKIWIVNVGDIKPMELPISFFLDYAWNPQNYSLEKLPIYTTEWASQQFGETYAKEIADLLDKYTLFNARRKPEMLTPDTYSLQYYREYENIVNDFKDLAGRAKKINNLLDPKYHDAYYQLVLFPILACSNLNELYYTVALNKQYASQNRVLTNKKAKKARDLFEKDNLLSHHYNTLMAEGKWNHMMDQTHIGYTYWQQPDSNDMPQVEIIKIKQKASMGVTIEGNNNWWPQSNNLYFPEFSPYGQPSFYFEIFNQGKEAFDCTITPQKKWIILNKSICKITDQERIEVSIDWNTAPVNKSESVLSIQSSNNEQVEMRISIFNPKNKNIKGNVISNGFVIIEADDFTNKHESKGVLWKVIPKYGKTQSGIKTFPSNHEPIELLDSNPYVEYSFHSFDTGWVELHCLLSPTLDYMNKGGIRFAVGLNDEKPQTINMHTQGTSQNWNRWVGDNIIKTISKHYISKVGQNKIRFYAIDAGIVLQRLIIDQGGLHTGYLVSIQP